MTEPTPIRPTDTFDERIQRLAIEHLDACYDAMYEHDEGNLEVESPAIAPFDGCSTCVVREVLSVTYDLLLAEAGRQALEDQQRARRPSSWERHGHYDF